MSYREAKRRIANITEALETGRITLEQAHAAATAVVEAYDGQ